MPTEDVINSIKNSIENSIKEDEELFGTKIDYILINPDNNDTVSIISDGVDKIVEFTPFTKEMKTGYSKVSEWDYSFDNYLFKDLENFYQIGYMSAKTHYNIWNSIEELYPESIYNKDGVQWYLQFCADNGITKEYLDKKTNLDTPNILKYFEGLAYHETMTYRGYIIEADDTNIDNRKENLINIYENKEDFDKKVLIETVSLKTVNLKQDIKDYVDEFYVDKDVANKEKLYFAFVIGYDFLNDEFKNSLSPECDLTYGFCNKIAEDFMNSDDYKYENLSGYELLEKYIKENKFEIMRKYEQFIGVKDVYFQDNRKLLETGNRGEQPIAFIEWKKANRKEYVIAIDYSINDGNISWSRGYYYMSFNEAKRDFNRVKNGEYLISKNKEHERSR